MKKFFKFIFFLTFVAGVIYAIQKLLAQSCAPR